MTPAVDITLSGGYYFHALNRIVRDLSPLLHLRQPAAINIDLRRLTFMGPTALALTVALLHELRQRNMTLDGGFLAMPNAPGIRRYLQRMDFLREIFQTADFDQDQQVRADDAPLLECRHFADNESLRQVVQDLLVVIDSKVSTDTLGRTSLQLALSEMVENVFFHADAPFGGFVAAQALRGTDELEIGIVDLGIGVRRSMDKNPDFHGLYTDDLSAIEVALQPTYTSTPGRNAGLGLAFSELLLKQNDGRLIVRSGEGHVQKGAKETTRVYEGDDLPGTMVGMRLRTDRPADFREAYSALDEMIARMRSDELHYYVRPDEDR